MKMKKIGLLVSASLLLLAMSTSAFAMTGIPVNGEPAMNEVDFSSLNTISTPHDETVGNPLNWYKGWWWVTLTNNTAKSWASVSISPGVTDKVALVQGNGLVDEWGFPGNSIAVNKAGNFVYSGSKGPRLYENGVTGDLWCKAVFTFNTALAPTQKVSFKIYTDNSYYTGPFADSFSMTLTPTAVPEPSGIMAIMMGLGGLGTMIRRRK